MEEQKNAHPPSLWPPYSETVVLPILLLKDSWYVTYVTVCHKMSHTAANGVPGFSGGFGGVQANHVESSEPLLLRLVFWQFGSITNMKVTSQPRLVTSHYESHIILPPKSLLCILALLTPFRVSTARMTGRLWPRRNDRHADLQICLCILRHSTGDGRD